MICRGCFCFAIIVVLVSVSVIQSTTQLNQDKATRHLEAVDKSSSQYPKDLLLSQPYVNSPRKYLLVFHVIGVLYMFAGLAIVCDDYFVMALEVMVERWEITEDVAGATFMAAGGSAPELFTSIMGVFVSKDDVGFGTIVGSAVFNVLFVIALCALFAKETLALTWWPLFRDCSYYIISLIVLVLFIGDGYIVWYEGIILFLLYIIYVLVMSKNEQLRDRAETWANSKQRCSNNVVAPETNPAPKSELRGSVQLDPVAVQSLMRRVRSVAMRTIIQNKLASAVATRIDKLCTKFDQLKPTDKVVVTTAAVLKKGTTDNTELIPSTMASICNKRNSLSIEDTDDVRVESFHESPEHGKADCLRIAHDGSRNRSGSVTQEIAEEFDDDSPFEWPDEFRSQVVFIAVLPIVTILFVTIPNCKNSKWKKYFLVTFFLSLIWIALFTYGMVWWASIIGDALGIPSVVMGVTVLAAGTSIPDALSSVIVARRGFGDMAVSSSIGSNIFDILVGLPIPWIIKTCLVDVGSSVRIVSDTLQLSVATLLSMVVLVICSIIYTKWRLDKKLGFIMFALYLVFLAQTLILEYY